MEIQKTIKEIAFDYHKLGFNVVPQLKNKATKVAWKAFNSERQTSEQLTELISKHEKATNSKMNLAIICGKVSDIVVIDLDNDIAVNYIKELKLPITPTVISNRGYHLYFRYPSKEIKSYQKILGDKETDPIIDIISDKHLITIPPSEHQSGKIYKWAEGRSIFDIEIQPLPQHFIDIVNNFEINKKVIDYNTIAKTTRELPTTDILKANINIMDLFNKFNINLSNVSEHGDHIKIQCPFHDEEEASFSIYTNTNSYHCFGCGVSGDIFTLTEKWLNIDFREAINYLAREFNFVNIPTIFPNKQENLEEFTINIVELCSIILQKVKYINFKNIYRAKTNENKKEPTFKEKCTIVMCELNRILEQSEYKIVSKNKQIYFYNRAFWIQTNEDYIKKFISEVCLKSGLNEIECKQHDNIDNMYNQLLSEMIRFDIDKTKKVSVNLLNGTVFFDNGFKIRKFDYKDFFTYQLTFDYNNKKECPLFMNYLNKVLPCQQTQDMLQEFSGYIFTKNTMLKLEKVAVLFGIGSNGKSVFFDIISAILGEENKISLSLTDLQQEHYRAMIVDKLLCYSSEMGKGTDHDLFKKLASGEPISARHKYGKAFTAENYCRFMFNTNELPAKVEHTDAFFRRFLIIPFNVQISDEEKDPNLARKIIENELPGVFNWILEGLARLTKTKRFTISKESESILYDFMTEQDSVKKWLDGFIEKEDGGRVLKFYLDDGYKNYKGYCDADGFRPVGKKNFSNRILNNGYDKRRDGAGIFFEENIPF